MKGQCFYCDDGFKLMANRCVAEAIKGKEDGKDGKELGQLVDVLGGVDNLRKGA